MKFLLSIMYEDYDLDGEKYPIVRHHLTADSWSEAYEQRDEILDDLEDDGYRIVFQLITEE